MFQSKSITKYITTNFGINFQVNPNKDKFNDKSYFRVVKIVFVKIKHEII